MDCFKYQPDHGEDWEPFFRSVWIPTKFVSLLFKVLTAPCEKSVYFIVSKTHFMYRKCITSVLFVLDYMKFISNVLLKSVPRNKCHWVQFQCNKNKKSNSAIPQVVC